MAHRLGRKQDGGSEGKCFTGIDLNRLEMIIVRIIEKIRYQRGRACYQSVSTKLHQGGEFNLEMDDLKIVINNMIGKNIIQNKGKVGHESLYKSTARSDKMVGKSDLGKVESSEQAYINEQFHKTLTNMINKEVIDQVNNIETNENMKRFITEQINLVVSKLHPVDNTTLLPSTNVANKSNHEYNSNDVLISSHENRASLQNSNVLNKSNHECNTILIESLKSEITFLRNQLMSKDKIIELLISDRNHVDNNNNLNKAQKNLLIAVM